MDNPPNNRGAAIRETREAAGLTRAALARLANCSPSMLKLIETGFSPNRSEARLRVERALAALGYPVDAPEPAGADGPGRRGGK